MGSLGQYGVFVVRVWHEPEGGADGPWRASVLDTVTRERHYFTDAAALVAFLEPLGLSEKGSLSGILKT